MTIMALQLLLRWNLKAGKVVDVVIPSGKEFQALIALGKNEFWN